jgi:hypothetical protein
MADGPISPVAAVAAGEVQVAQVAAQPTPQQTARFEAQIAEAVPLQYGAPVSGGAAGDSLRPVMDYATRVSNDYRAELERREVRIDPEMWPELYVLQQVNREMRGFSLLQMQLEFMGKGVEVANRGTQVLYQQS